MLRAACTGLVALLVAACAAAPAGAEVGASPYPTSQAIAADAQFLEYAPPPAQPGVVCLVDSGVDLNPDTVGALVGAEARDPAWGTGDGLAQVLPRVDGHPAGHGTEMAMLMAAPENGWGMVGIAPTSVRVYSIRVVPAGQTTFPFANYSYAITRCLKLHLTSQAAISVVSLSIAGNSNASQADLSQLEDTVDTTRQHGINVISAAGNDLPTVYYPAAYPSVLSVGAGDVGANAVGALCPFSRAGSVDVLAPGCDSEGGGIDQAFEDDGGPALGFGTSQAAALTSAVLAAMRAYAPALGVTEAELCLTRTEQNGGNMDVAKAFDACGLGDVVRAGLAAAPSPQAPPPDQVASDGGPRIMPTPTHTVVSPPRLGRVRLHRGVLSIHILNRPVSASTEVKVFVRRGRRSIPIVIRRFTSDRVSLRVHSANSLAARFVLLAGGRTSAWITRVIA